MASREKEVVKFRVSKFISSFLIGIKNRDREYSYSQETLLQIPVSPEQAQFIGPTMPNNINRVSNSDAAEMKHTANKITRSQACRPDELLPS